ncbi:MAG: trypsin-like peptidase domain-containing protein [Devosia sp.]
MRTVFGVLIAASIAATPAAADPTLFPGSDYGEVNLRLRESIGPAVMTILTAGHIFERVGRLPPDDVIRVAAGPVVRLDRLVETQVGGQTRTATSTCTATIVGPELVLTNHHCIPGSETVLKASILIDYEDPDDPDAIRVPIETTPVKADAQLDYALVRITGALPEHVKPLKFEPVEASPGTRLVIIHHPAGRPKMMTQYQCRAHETNSSREFELRHVCDTLPGSSGALIINSAMQPVGLHHTGGLNENDPESYNVATRLTAVRNAVLEASGATPKTPDPTPATVTATQSMPATPSQPVTPQAPQTPQGTQTNAAVPSTGAEQTPSSSTDAINELLN